MASGLDPGPAIRRQQEGLKKAFVKQFTIATEQSETPRCVVARAPGPPGGTRTVGHFGIQFS